MNQKIIMKCFIKLIIVYSAIILTSSSEDSMIREISSRRTIFLPSEEASFEWRLGTRGDGEDFVGIVRNGEFTIDSCGPFIYTHILDASGLNIEGSFEWTLPSEEGVYNLYVFRKNTILSSSHTHLANCEHMTSGFDIVNQYDIAVHENETAIIFDGENDFVSMSISGCPSEKFTFETWIRCHGDCSNQEIMSIQECDIQITLGNNFQYISRDDRIVYATSRGSVGTTLSRVQENRSTFATSYGLVTDGRWHHIAAVVSNHTAVFYVDGVPGEFVIWEDSLSVTQEDNNVSLLLGSNFRGTISETRLWYEARTRSEIRSQMYVRVSNNDTSQRQVWSFLSREMESIDDEIQFHGDADMSITRTPFSSHTHDIGVQITYDTIATELPLLSTLSIQGSGTTRIQCTPASGLASPWERWCGGTNTTQTPIYGENKIVGYADLSHPCMAAWHGAMLMQESIFANPIVFDLNWVNTIPSFFSSSASEFPPIITSSSLSSSRPAFKITNSIVGPKAGAVEVHETGASVDVFVSIGHQPLCRGLRSLVNGLCYYLIPQTYIWSDAKQACRDWGGRIAQVRTQYDRNFIESMISEYESENPLEDSLHPMWISTDPYDEFGLFIDIFNETGSEEEWELCVFATNCRFPVMCERVLRVDMQYLLPISAQTNVHSLTVGDPELPQNPLLMTKTALDWNDGTDTLRIECIDDNMIEGPRHGDTIVIRGLPGDPTFVSNPIFLPVVIVSDGDEAEMNIDWDSRPLDVSEENAVAMSLESSCVESCRVNCDLTNRRLNIKTRKHISETNSREAIEIKYIKICRSLASASKLIVNATINTNIPDP